MLELERQYAVPTEDKIPGLIGYLRNCGYEVKPVNQSTRHIISGKAVIGSITPHEIIVHTYDVHGKGLAKVIETLDESKLPSTRD